MRPAPERHEFLPSPGSTLLSVAKRRLVPFSRPERAIVLVAVLTLLTFLSTMAVIFSTLSRVERSTAQNYVDRLSARMLAYGGIEKATAALEDAFQEGRLGDPAAEWVCPDPPSLPLEKCLNPSFKEGEALGAGYSGSLGASYLDRGNLYRLRVKEASSLLSINGGVLADRQAPSTLALEQMLRNLIGALIANGKGTSLETPLARRILDMRPSQGYTRREDLQRLGVLSSAAYDQLAPYLTAHGVPDPSTVRLEFRRRSTGEYYFWSVSEPRIPIDLNHASEEVLTALFAGISSLLVEPDLTLMAGTTLASALLSPPPLTLSSSEAQTLARNLVLWRKTNGAVTSWAKFYMFLRQNLSAAKADMVLANCNPNTGTTGSNPDFPWRSFGFWLGWGRPYLRQISKFSLLYPGEGVSGPGRTPWYTTEACLLPLHGVFEIEAQGVVHGPGGKVASQHAVFSVFHLYEGTRLSTQMDFNPDPALATSPAGSLPQLGPHLELAPMAAQGSYFMAAPENWQTAAKLSAYEGQLQLRPVATPAVTPDLYSMLDPSLSVASSGLDYPSSTASRKIFHAHDGAPFLSTRGQSGPPVGQVRLSKEKLLQQADSMRQQAKELLAQAEALDKQAEELHAQAAELKKKAKELWDQAAKLRAKGKKKEAEKLEKQSKDLLGKASELTKKAASLDAEAAHKRAQAEELLRQADLLESFANSLPDTKSEEFAGAELKAFSMAFWIKPAVETSSMQLVDWSIPISVDEMGNEELWKIQIKYDGRDTWLNISYQTWESTKIKVITGYDKKGKPIEQEIEVDVMTDSDAVSPMAVRGKLLPGRWSMVGFSVFENSAKQTEVHFVVNAKGTQDVLSRNLIATAGGTDNMRLYFMNSPGRSTMRLVYVGADYEPAFTGAELLDLFLSGYYYPNGQYISPILYSRDGKPIYWQALRWNDYISPLAPGEVRLDADVNPDRGSFAPDTPEFWDPDGPNRIGLLGRSIRYRVKMKTFAWPPNDTPFIEDVVVYFRPPSGRILLWTEQ